MDNYLKRKVTAIRKTSEKQRISVTIEKGELKADYRKHIAAPIASLKSDDFASISAWRAGLKIDISLDMPDFQLIHLGCQDASMTVGKAVGEFVRVIRTSGYGFATGVIDEAKADAVNLVPGPLIP